MLTGVLDNTSRPVLFTVNEEDFTFEFMTESVYEYGKPLDMVELPNKNGFLFGRTHDNHKIAIDVGDNKIKVGNTQKIKVEAYVVSYGNINDDNIEEFTAISFIGGTLNRVFQANRIHIDPISLEIKTMDDTLSYAIEADNENINIKIYSSIWQSHTQNGTFINNSDVTLTIEFGTPKHLNDVFKYYRVIKKTLSFMCFRKNVGFDRIQLLTSSQDDPKVLLPNGYFFMNDEKNIALKDWQTNICVNDMGEAFPNLIKLFFDESEESRAPIIRFLPENDEDLYQFYPSKVKEICSALEIEYKYVSKEETKNDKLLDEIRKTVLDTLSEFKKQHADFSESSYSLLKSDVSHWSLSLRDRITYLCQHYLEELLLVHESDGVISDQAILKLVQYRNAATHSGVVKINQSIIETAFYVQVVIYCSVLERVGMSRETIKTLCPYRLLR